MKRLQLISHFALVLGSAALIPATASLQAAVTRSGNADVTLVSFGSLQGDVSMCGCHSGPKGGLARRAAYLDTLAAQVGPLLHLDLGDFASTQELTSEFETRFVWGMMERMKVAATAIGPRELTAWPVVRQLVAKGSVPFVCSNVRLRQGGAEFPIGESYHLLESNGVRVALFSLMGPEEYQSVPARQGVEFVYADPFATAGPLVSELRRQADLVVLLSQMSTAETDSLVRTVPGIDVALYGHEAEYEDAASRVGSTIVNRTGVRGQYLGRLTLAIDPQGKVVESRSSNFALGKILPEDTQIAQEVEGALAKVKQMRVEERARRQAEFERKLLGTGK